MKKYYIGIIVLLGLCAGSVVYTLSQAGAAKADKLTDQAVEQIGTKMETYVADKGHVPQSLSEIGVNNIPPTVSYQALTDSKYKVCFDYHTASSGFDASWFSLFSGGISSNNQPQIDNNGGGYFDSSIEFSHKKGNNCQTVDAGSLNSYYPTQDNFSPLPKSDAAGCGQKAYEVYGTAEVSSVNIAAKQISFSSENQYVYDQNGSLLKLTTKTYDKDTLVCNADLKKIDISQIKAGQKVSVSLSSSSDSNISELDLY
jgi:type II secretory pathway pseudopilin PulG